jgi:hypothetical protein
VIGEDGAAIPGVWVSAGLKGHYRGNDRSDEEGAFEVRGVIAGEVEMVFQAPGFLRESRKVDTRQTTVVNVTLGRGLSISGQVVHAGAPVANAEVFAGLPGTGHHSPGRLTDEQGRFTLPGLAPGRYRVSASAEGKGTSTVEVDAASSGPLQMVLELPPQAVLTGRIVGLTAEDDVRAVAVSVRTEGGRGVRAHVKPDMTFRMTDAPVGRVRITSYANTKSSTRAGRTVELVLERDRAAETTIEFTREAVRGVVTRDGQPLPDVFVTFSTEGLGIRASDRADVNGRYEILGLEPGRYGLQVSDYPDVYLTTERTIAGPGTFDIEVTAKGSPR